ncbi:MAG TPA: hypothetical protein VFW45_09790 [Candidatus Polarisedimenticolia bacterium]|nr:hypothetical protein [Candidatus Polarisedimenticolia bacterium]
MRSVLRRLAVAAALTGAVSVAPSLAATHTYLILPFEDSAPERSRDWLREAMALSLADYFLGAGQHVIDREERLAAMEELDLPDSAPLTLATSLRLGRHFRSRDGGQVPDRLVVGRYSLEDGQISATARVLRLDANAAFPWKEESGNLQDLLHLQRSLAQSLLRSDSVGTGNLGSHSDDASAGRNFPLVAYENYIRGMIEPSPAKQLGYLNKAVELFPGYPKAGYQLARLLARSGKKKEAEDVLKGMTGEPSPYGAEYHAFKGTLELDAGRIPEAEAEAKQSMSIRETAAGHILMAKLALSRSDAARALRELDRAEELDPDDPDVDALRRQVTKTPAPKS